MTALALRAASFVNGVSQLHGQVTRDMWGPIWPGVAAEDRPGPRDHQRRPRPDLAVVRHDARCSTRTSQPGWLERHDDPAVWEAVLRHPGRGAVARPQRAAQLPVRVHPRARAPALEGRTRQRRPGRRRRDAARSERADDRLRAPLHRLQAPRADLPRRRTACSRFSLAARRPVQIVFAGKAHPADETGKHHLQQVYRHAIDPKFGGRIAFVDDYDLHVAHFLVQGCDVWLNNPRKPLEASGTSGMKASINGVPHLSIGDGWWAEALLGSERLADRRPDDTRPTPQPSTPRTPRRSINCSKHEVVPRFYQRDARGISDRAGSTPYARRSCLSRRVQRPPDGPGVRRDDVRSGARASERAGSR